MINLWILNKEFQQVGLIDDYSSLIWSKRYIEIGDCEVYIAANSRTIALLQKGFYILRDDDDMICRIETIEIDTDAEKGDFLIVTGYDCRKILNQRIVWDQTIFKGTAENFIRKIITDNVINPKLAKRKISNIRLGELKGFNDAIEIQSTYDYVFDKIKELCTTYNYGSTITFDGAYFVFNLYRGVDRSVDQELNDVVMFSPEFDNLITTKYKEDTTQFKTAALVAGEGEGTERTRVEIDHNPTGLERVELYVDAKDVSSSIEYETLIEAYPNGSIVQEDDVVYYKVNNVKIAILDNIDEPTTGTLLGEPYEILLNQRGIEKLSEATNVVTFEGEVEPNYSYVYGQDYFLGDVVTVENDYGIQANARIVEVIESDADSGYSIIPTFEYISLNNEE